MVMGKPIDENRLRELADDFGADDLAEIIDAFLEEASEAVDALEQCLSDEPSQARVEYFHFLAGAARNLGAIAFGALCQQLERENGSFSANDYHFFRAEYQTVLDYFGEPGGFDQLAATG